jgi:hypothetical protein
MRQNTSGHLSCATHSIEQPGRINSVVVLFPTLPLFIVVPIGLNGNLLT